MRARFLALALWAGLAASTAVVMPYFPPPTPIYEAPIDRALQNVSAMEGLEPAQRERLLGRLNLLAYARDDGAFAYMRENNELNEGGSQRCVDVGPGSGRQAQEPPPTFAPEDLCARFTFDIRPQNELPPDPEHTSPRGIARLEAARTHYREALRIDGANLRARLGYAYVLDRLGRTGEARRELRTIIRLGLPRLAEDHSDWEDHAVLTESAEHLQHLVKTHSDRARLTQLHARLLASQPIIYVTPIFVPLTEGAFNTMIDNGASVAFDFAGTGDTRAQGWLTPNAAWLVWDPEWRGHVRSGFDMIGQRAWSVFWSDGFEALRALDDNRDGELTGAELGGLSLWRDENGDGVSDPGEVLPANVHGIAALSVRGTPTRPGLITAPAGVRFEDGRARPLYDWTPGLGAAPVS